MVKLGWLMRFEVKEVWPGVCVPDLSAMLPVVVLVAITITIL